VKKGQWRSLQVVGKGAHISGDCCKLQISCELLVEIVASCWEGRWEIPLVFVSHTKNHHLPLNQVKTDMTVKQPIARVVSVEPDQGVMSRTGLH